MERLSRLNPLRSEPANKRLGTILVDQGLLTPEQLEAALRGSRAAGLRLGAYLTGEGLVSAPALFAALGTQLGVPFVELSRQQVPQEIVRLVSEEVARRYKVLPLSREGEVLVLATSEPQDVVIIEDIQARIRIKVKPVLATVPDIEEALTRHYRATGEIERQLSQIAPSAPATATQERVSREIITSSPVVRAVDLIISQAIRDRASDIHLEPQRDGVRVRYRIDGILHEVMQLPLGVHAAMLSRMKVMAGMNIAERRRPQDGQFTAHTDQGDVDVRAATIETAEGEMMVLRILDKSSALLSLADLGFQSAPLQAYQRMLRAPYGVILCAGPTGAGKTTTLYAAVHTLDKRERNIITIEDPVEYRFNDINQIQVNRQADITFATGLRAIMRLDPDIILVGEIRDQETAQIATQAALTGHLVLSSIHANDAVGAVFRMIDLGVDPLLLTSALLGTVSQRLVRRICPDCRVEYEPPLEELMAYREQVGEEHLQFYRGAGCNRCANTGFLSRTAVFEVLSLTEGLRGLILRGSSHDEARKQALADGFIPMSRDGMFKAREGVTTVAEVLRHLMIL